MSCTPGWCPKTPGCPYHCINGEVATKGTNGDWSWPDPCPNGCPNRENWELRAMYPALATSSASTPPAPGTKPPSHGGTPRE